MSHPLIRPLLGFLVMVFVTALYLEMHAPAQEVAVLPQREIASEETPTEPKVAQEENTPSPGAEIIEEFSLPRNTVIAQETKTIGNTISETVTSIVTGTSEQYASTYRSLLLSKGYVIINESVAPGAVAFYGRKNEGDMSIGIQASEFEGTSYLTITTLTQSN
jgi:hypothetical protein